MVRDHGPHVDEVRWDGLVHACRPAPGVIDALVESTLVVIASSSPMASIAPILGVAGVRDALERRRGPTLALSPVVLGRPPATDRDRHRDAARQPAAGSGRRRAHRRCDRGVAGTARVALRARPERRRWSPTTSPRPVPHPCLAPVIGIDSDERTDRSFHLFDIAARMARSSIAQWRPTRRTIAPTGGCSRRAKDSIVRTADWMRR